MASSSAGAAALRTVTLDDKYELEAGRVFLTGAQAFVRLLILQRQRDKLAGLNTGGFVSGYRGSPLGALDLSLWKAQKFLDRANIRFQPGLNEDLAATAIWGSQQVNIYPDAKVDGVFGMWYGKGPGVDRCGDVFKHANFAGTSKHGGVIVLAGDDHAAKSSTLPHQSDHQFSAAMMPVLYPASVQEILDLGLHGWAMSRYSGCWVGFKCVSDTVESSASVYVDPERVKIIVPDDFPLPPDGVSIRWPDPFLATEARMQDYKAYAALHYCRVNQLNRIIIDSPNPRLGIITSGKSYLDVRQALDDLGIDEAQAAEIGIRLFKVAMPWPLEPEGVRNFADGLAEILVVEEKRQIVEYQLKEQLYNWRDDVRPRVVGKFDEKGEWVRPHGDWLLPPHAELTPAMIARVIAQRIQKLDLHPRTMEKLRARVDWINAKEAALARQKIILNRIPYFCSGCPHNTSTNVPEGSRSTAGIGCHVMAIWMDRATSTYTHMGAEGVPWIGQAPFTSTKHIFANLGDGTYYHSGILAIRAAVAAKVNITYKILYNDAVAMTGGQPFDGPLSPQMIARQCAAEGASKIVVVSDEPNKYPAGYFASDIAIHDRSELDRVQRELRDTTGCTILLYDQTCAAEKRRRRKRGKYPDPAKRVVINELVCEGCGDCGVKSNCVSVAPVETEFGRKRTIDQSSCNKDYSCVNGFCPSFVTVEGGTLRKPKKADAVDSSHLPAPTLPATTEPYSILVTGIGGTGVVTIGALLGMAAHLEGKGVSVLDMTGLAQKNGAVVTHVRVADKPETLHATRIAAGEAKLVLACDIVTGVGNEALAKMQKGVTKALVNTALVMPADFTRNADLVFPTGSMEQEIRDAVSTGDAEFLDATRLATGLMGDSIATNLFMVGYAYQRGLIPVGEEAILRAIELNAAAVEANKQSFRWGRLAALEPERVLKLAIPQEKPDSQRASGSLDEIIARRAEFLTAYQDAAYAKRYTDLVAKVRVAETQKLPASTALTEAVARYYFKLLAIKDEYEVARLYSNGDFVKRVAQQFEGDYKLVFHLAPPLTTKADAGGEPKKKAYGPWMMSAFRVLAKMKGLRGTALDFFGRTEDRRQERHLITDYEALVAEILPQLAAHNHAIAVELAAIPEHIRGYGHVKQRHLKTAKAKEAELVAKYRSAKPPSLTQAVKVAA
ncbi:MAG TPA: indolepyruvate ferredoxin oxidoreductase family protein [Casimicrobiaceae bacterium]|jgi:indolepyruvate ferredoxin oxidoreductase|nr:indolepyruvate ferredoxin oxidoreductase family protein [Casimicrobiaceae bacterium]